MNYDCPFNSRDTAYKSAFGAVPAGEDVRLRILLPRDLQCSGAVFSYRKDDSEQWISCGMFWAGMCEYSHEWWDITFTPAEEGLYWYHFEYQTPYGRHKITQSTEYGGVGILSDKGKEFQQTVYAADFATPDWLKGGIMYQIFPDRFAYSGKPKKNVPSDRILRTDWCGQPNFRPDANNKILNNDYFQGDLQGIIDHLDHLESLGVSCIYLNPIFEAHSNHRYDTADYSRIDPMLGNEDDLHALCREAEKRGMAVILDGVFSHTGCDSVYFNRYRRYCTDGAFNSMDSPYYSWYTFQRWPDKYSSWWGIELLPEVREESPAFLNFITGPQGVLSHWLNVGIKGWRLDVADELPDKFLDALRARVKEEKPDAIIIGEVWEDASNKISYSQRRRYLLGQQLDSVMNYPFSNAILDFIKGGSANRFMDIIYSVMENYPPQVLHVLMNHIGTHDTERALTNLAGEPANGRDREWQNCQKLSDGQRKFGYTLLTLASALQFTLPGVPSIYYGDEAGMEGYRDPFNRGCYPWGQEVPEILAWYQRLGKIRRSCPALIDGGLHCLIADGNIVAYERQKDDDLLLCAVNRGSTYQSVKLNKDWIGAVVLAGHGPDISLLSLPPYSFTILGKGNWAEKFRENNQ